MLLVLVNCVMFLKEVTDIFWDLTTKLMLGSYILGEIMYAVCEDSLSWASPVYTGLGDLDQVLRKQGHWKGQT